MATVTKSSKVLKASKLLFKGQPKHYRRTIKFRDYDFQAFDQDRALTIWFADMVSNGEYTSLEELELYDCELDLGFSQRSEDETDIQAKQLSEAIQFCSSACEEYSMRYLLAGMLFDPDGWLVATDARRLHRRMVGKIASNHFNGCTVRASDCEVVVGLIKLFGDDIVSVRFSENRAHFRGLHWAFSCDLIFGKFPNWRAIFPTESLPVVAEFQRKELRQQCELEKRNAALRNKMAKDKLTSKERKDFTDEIPGVLIANVKYDARFLLDAMEGLCGSTVAFHRADGSSALFLADAGFGYSACMMGLK